MATEIKTNQKAFLAKLQKEAILYHKRLMEGIALNADEIRRRAWKKYMVRAGALGYEQEPGFKRSPKTHPTKLLIRTGRLKRILDSPGKWHIPRTATQARLKASSQHLLFTITPQLTSKTWFYLLNMRIMPRGDKLIHHRLTHEKGKGKFPPDSGNLRAVYQVTETKEGKIKRTRLIRPRPFFEPSIMDQKFKFERVVHRKLRRSMNKVL